MSGLADAPAQAVLQTFPFQSVNDLVVLVGDIDADGTRDLVFERYLGPTVGRRLDVYSLRTGALLHQFAPPAQHGYLSVSRVGDIDGDGYDDIAHHEYRPTSAYTVIRSGVSGAYIQQFLWTGPGSLQVLGLDDINTDGRDEIVLSESMAVVNGLTDAGRCDILDGATGQILRSHLGTFAGQELHCRAVLGDVDGDGKRDYLVASNTHFWGYSGATGAQVFSFPKLTQSYGEYLTDIGDFNADGFDDIVFQDRGSYPFAQYEQLLAFAGPSMTQLLWSHTRLYQNPGPEWYSRPLGNQGDIDGDGHFDLGLMGGTNGVTSTILSGRDQSVIYALVPAPGTAASIYHLIGGPGDVDGDGFPDFLVAVDVSPGVSVLRLTSGAPPGVLSIGAGCANSIGLVPTIGVGIGARLGRTMTVNLANTEPSLLAAVLGVGFSNQQWNSTPLPIDLGAYGLPGCSWRVAADVALLVPTVGANGTRHHATHDVPVPQVPQLLGVALYWQWLVLEQGPTGAAGSVTGAVRTTIVP